MTEPLHILHLINHVKNVGNGIVNVAVDLAIEQRRSGHDVTVASAGGEFTALLEAHGVRHLLLAQTGKQSVVALLRLSLFVRREKINIVHAHMMTGALIARVSTTFTRTRVVTTVHNSWQRHAVLMKAGHSVIAVSEAVRLEMIGRGISPAKICTVHNGTVGSVRPQGATGKNLKSLESPAILTIAGLYMRKGIIDLIQAARILRESIPDVKIYIAGQGPDKDIFQDAVHTNGLEDTVIFLGFRQDVAALLKQGDVFVLASHSEPFGLVLGEARQADIPIVATNVGGIPEALDGGNAGLLVPPHDPQALAEAIARVLQDKTLSDRLRCAGAENLQALHVRRVSEETLDVYRKVL